MSDSENEELRARLAQTEKRLHELEAAQTKEREPERAPIAIPLARMFMPRKAQLKAMLSALLIAFVFVAGFGAGLAPTCIGALGRSTGPVVCPKGYDHSFTKTWSTVQGATEGEHWEVHCVMPDGSDQPASSWVAVPTLTFYFAIPFLVAAAYLVVRYRSKKSES